MFGEMDKKMTVQRLSKKIGDTKMRNRAIKGSRIEVTR